MVVKRAVIALCIRNPESLKYTSEIYMDLIDYKENKFDGMETQIISVDRHRELHRMMTYLGNRPNYLVKPESYLEGMCNHLNLFKIINNKGHLVAKIVNDFGKNFYYYEKGDQNGKKER